MSSYRFLLSRRWLILTVVAIALMPTMVRLGIWQLHRHEGRVAHNRLIADSLRAKPVPVADLTSPGAPFDKDHTWRTVTATGRYDPAHQVVVRQRTAADGGTIGYYLVTPLVLSDGDAVLVNRGWIPSGDNITAFPKVPATPSGQVRITGRLRPDETTADSGIKDKPDLPPRQVMMINSSRLGKETGRTLLTGYIELTGTSPKPSGHQPELVPEPDHTGIGPHLAYAIQWWLFTAMVPVGWVVLARRERRDLAEAAAKAKRPASGPGGSDKPGNPPGPSGSGTPGAPAARSGADRAGDRSDQPDAPSATSPAAPAAEDGALDRPAGQSGAAAPEPASPPRESATLDPATDAEDGPVPASASGRNARAAE